MSSCDNLNREKDEFDGTVTISYEVSSESDISFLKIIRKGVSTYYLSIRIKEAGIYRGKGVTILLNNGQKIDKPLQTVDSDYSSGSFYTSTFLPLTLAELKIIKQSSSMKYKLYISKGESSFNKEMLTCLINSK